MAEEDKPDHSSDQFEAALDAYREAYFGGTVLNPEQFCRDHPECGPKLREEIESFLMVAAVFPMFDAKADDEATDESGAGKGRTSDIMGDFRLVREIGRGGMGVVYEAEQVSLNRKVALKILPLHLGFARETVLKFHREAKAGGRQCHPGIVAVYEVGEHEGVHYIAQELVEGSYTLADKLEALREEGDLPTGYFREVANYIVEAADALHHAHEAGVIHRDVKPSNILLTKEERPKITDFGLAKLEDAMALSRTGDFAGTPFYMSPEQVTGGGKGVDRRTDIYSLGVTLYELLTLRQPFEGKSSFEVLKKIPVAEPLDPRRFNPRVPRDLSTICLKTMEKAPEKRYTTMEAFADDLRRYLAGEVVLARPAGITTKTLKRIKRNPVLSGAVGMAAFAMLALMVWGAVYFIQMKSRYEEIQRQSDLGLVYRLEEEAENLWPAYPWKIEEFKAWLVEARPLLARLEQYHLELERLQSTGRISADVATQRDFLDKLVLGIDRICHEESGLIADVEGRLRFAETVHERSIEKHRAEWEEAIASIADEGECPQYGGLVMDPILGFVPIGRDPDSGLWEFAHIQTGEIPRRDSERRLVLKKETGLVFVLIPAGTFCMGAIPPDNVDYFEGDPNVDPQARPYEGPPHTVTIGKHFLLSKYEMTQGQWLRATGENPSEYAPGTVLAGKAIDLVHPVEMVNWDDSTEVLFRLNLRLPTDAEWEYAARAGTRTIRWTGDDVKTLEKAANLYDRTCYRVMPEIGGEYRPSSTDGVDWLDDGYPVHAPVGTYLPNSFGLHDVLGNVYEWCQDDFTRSYEETPVDGSAFVSAGSTKKVIRSGGWDSPPLNVASRSAFRHGADRGVRFWDTGLRPALSLP